MAKQGFVVVRVCLALRREVGEKWLSYVATRHQCDFGMGPQSREAIAGEVWLHSRGATRAGNLVSDVKEH
jgi:hypothetical protein